MKFAGLALPPAFDNAIRACKEHLRLAAALSALVNILYLAPTIYMMQVYDRVVSTGGLITLLWLTVIAGFAIATMVGLDTMRSRIMMKAGLRLDRILAKDILDRVLQRRMAGATSGSAQALRDFDSVRMALSGAPALALFDLPWTPIYVLVAFLLHPYLGLFVLLAAALVFGLTLLNERAVRAGTKVALRTMTGSYLAQERLAQQSEVIRALGMREAVVGIQLEERRDGLAQSTAHQLIGGRCAAIAKFLRIFLQSLALGLGAWLAVERQISAGSIIATSVLLSRALQPIEQLVGSWKALIEARQALENLADLFDATGAGASASFTLSAPRGELAVHQLTVLRPSGGDPLLAQIGFALEAGEMVGVIGPSGAGKSTLMRALAGAIQSDHGVVRVDGSDIRDWDPEKLARHMGFLPQDCGLLPGTVADNISRFATARGEPKADVDAAVLRAAELAGVHGIITHLPGGYDMRVGWNNEGLSAGQRQRIALARALYGDPAILLLDEPNAALDAEGEAALTNALAISRDRGATIIVAAHRPAILAPANRLLLLNGGRVAAYGPSDEIRNRLGMRPMAVVTEPNGETSNAAA